MIVFENDGEIDVRSIKTIGVSAKEEGAIGFFGSGLKYAISIILRTGQNITIMSGEDVYHFSVKKTTIRDKEFDIVCMNDDELGFTTEFGKTWDVWQAVREILCNCTDEGGSHYAHVTRNVILPEKGKTRIIVSGNDFEKAYGKRHEFLLEDRTPFYSVDGLEVYHGETKNLFYKGVKVHSEDKSFMFTYNITHDLDLTEDRSLKYSGFVVGYTLSELLCKVTDRHIINKLLDCNKYFVEWYGEYSNCVSQEIKDRVRITTAEYSRTIPPKLRQKCSKDTSEILIEDVQSILNKVQEGQLIKAIAFLEFLGYNVKEYEIRVLDSLGEGVLGLAERKHKIIYIAKHVFDMGTKYVAGTIFEEYVHLKHKVDDETRQMQDTLINCMLSAGELALGEAL